jgi:hypothetical protein
MIIYKFQKILIMILHQVIILNINLERENYKWNKLIQILKNIVILHKVKLAIP